MPTHPSLPKVDLAELAAAVRPKGPGGKGRTSQLAQWLTQNREWFADLLARENPTMDSLAEGLTAQGLRNEAGRPITADRLRKTWWAVNGPRSRRRRPKTPPTKAELEAPKPAPTIQPPQPADEPEFGPVKFKR